jgi:hypothetical protein
MRRRSRLTIMPTPSLGHGTPHKIMHDFFFAIRFFAAGYLLLPIRYSLFAIR